MQVRLRNEQLYGYGSFWLLLLLISSLLFCLFKVGEREGVDAAPQKCFFFLFFFLVFKILKLIYFVMEKMLVAVHLNPSSKLR